MEINQKRLFSNGKINLPQSSSKKAKEEGEKHAENKAKTPNNPSFYSNYYGVHKVSFGKSQNTDEERLKYLRGIKTAEGEDVFPTYEEEKSTIERLSKTEIGFEFFKAMSEISYDNGKKVYSSKEKLEQLAELSTLLEGEEAETFDFYGKNIEIKIEPDYIDFLKTFINEKDENGNYVFSDSDITASLLMLYLIKPKETDVKEVYSQFKDMLKYDLGLQNTLELLEFTLVNDKSFDLEANIPQIREYIKEGCSPFISCKILTSDKKEIFKELMNYRDSDENLLFNGYQMLEISENCKDFEKVSGYIKSLLDKKDTEGKLLFGSQLITSAIISGENACKNVLKISETEDEEKKNAFLCSHRLEEIIKDDTTFERANKIFEQKNPDGQIICGPFSVLDIARDEEMFKRFIKYAVPMSEYKILNIDKIVEHTDEQCEQVLEIFKTAKEEENSSLLTYNASKYVEDKETFELTKKLLKIKNKKGKHVIDGLTLNGILNKGKEYAERYLRSAELLISDGLETSSSNITKLAENEELLKRAELFKEITNEEGKAVFDYSNLIDYANLPPEQAAKMVRVLKLKNSEGKHIAISNHLRKEIINLDDKEFKNIIEYTPQLSELRTSDARVFSDEKALINSAKLGEKAYLRAKELIDIKAKDGKAIFKSHEIPQLTTVNDSNWEILKTAISSQNSFGEEVFTNSSILSSITMRTDINDKHSFLEKSKALSELRNPNTNKRLLSDIGIYETAQQEKDFIPKIKEFAPELLTLKNFRNEPVITENNIHRYILDNDLSKEELCHYVNAFANFKKSSGENVYFYEKSILNILCKEAEYCKDALNVITEISEKSSSFGNSYVSADKLNKLSGEDIEVLRKYKQKLEKFDEFKNYPQENNICNIAERLAELSDEELEKCLKLARYKDRAGNPFFTYNEILYLSAPQQYRLTDAGVITTFSPEVKNNLEKYIDEVCSLKDKMLSKPMLYVNGEFDSEDRAKEQIEYFFRENKGKLLLMTTIFDKETIDIIMRKRIAVSSEYLNLLHGFDENRQDLLKRSINSSNQDSKPFMPTQKMQFIKLLSAYKANDLDTTELEAMLEEGRIDIGKLELNLLKRIIEKTGIDEETLSKVDSEKIYAWNSEYLHLLVSDMNNIPELKELFVASLTKDFREYILDSENKYGQANEKTKEAFINAGLNYDAWWNPNKDLAVTMISRDQNAQVLLQISKQIEEDIEALRRTPAKKYIDKQLSKYIKEDKFTVPSNFQMNKNLLGIFTEGTIKRLESVWERAKKNLSEPEKTEKAQNTLTILDHLEQRIKDIQNTQEVNLSKNLDLTIKMWERRPEKDIFQGNYSTCCIGIGNFNSSAMPHFVMDSAYNMIELTDNFSGKTIGNALCYFIKDQNGQPAFVIDNIEINNSNKPSNEIGIEIRNKMAEYASKVAKEVTGKDDTPIYMSNNYNDVSTEGLKNEVQTIELLGKPSTDRIYMDLFGGWTSSAEFKSERKLLRLR